MSGMIHDQMKYHEAINTVYVEDDALKTIK